MKSIKTLVRITQLKVNVSCKSHLKLKSKMSVSRPHSAAPVTLADPDAIYKLRIESKELVNHDVVRFVVALPSSQHTLGTKSGQHIFIVEKIGDQTVWRKYTPLNLEEHCGSIEMIIKIYRPNTHKSFPKGGVMTPHLESLKPGDYISIQGPIGRCVYLHNGNFELKEEKTSPKMKKHVKRLGMVAGGSGMAPFLQIVRTICNDPKDETKISMILANHTEDDIICKEEFDRLAREHSDKFKIWYTITKSVKPGWKYSLGYVNREMFQQHLPPPGDETLIMVCGPKPMVWSCCMPLLHSMGYSKDMLFKY